MEGSVTSIKGTARDQLKAFVERIERLVEEKKAIGEDVSSVYAEAKGAGFDPAALRDVVKARAADPQQRQEREAIFDLYMSTLGDAK